VVVVLVDVVLNIQCPLLLPVERNGQES
jgi:hypothetical protein